MTYHLLDAEMVDAIHCAVQNPGELKDLAGDKSLNAVLLCVDNRFVYGLMEDVFDLAAAYTVAIATGRVFNDANKRTAYKSMIVCLFINGARVDHDTTEAGDIIREVAQRRMDEDDLAAWLRKKAVD